MKTWAYWEGQTPPPVIELCIETARCHCPKYELLTPESAAEYGVPMKGLSKLNPAQKADVVRVFMLAHHGGTWVDTDVIMLRPPAFEEHFQSAEVVGFKNGHGVFPNACFAAEPDSEVMRRAWIRVEQRLQQPKIGYTELGQQILSPLRDEFPGRMLQLPKRQMFRATFRNNKQRQFFAARTDDRRHALSGRWAWDAYGYHLAKRGVAALTGMTIQQLLDSHKFASFIFRRALDTWDRPGRAREAVNRLPRGSAHYVEVGVWNGLTAFTVAQQRPECTIDLVDPYALYDDGPGIGPCCGPGKGGNQARLDRAHANVVAKAGWSGDRIRVHRLASAEAAPQYELLMRGHIKPDVLFIDGDHNYESVKHDAEAWPRHVKPGGWLGFHDCHEKLWPEVCRAVHEVMGPPHERGIDMTWWYKM